MLKRFIVIPFFLFVVLTSLFSFISFQKDNDPFVVVLDAGHGGHDPGNLGNGYMEKNIALKIVLEVGRILSSNQDIKVVYTRDSDSFVDLFVRGEIANKANADLFVSVHCDSHTSDAHGAGTFVLGLHANKQNFEIAKKENSVIYLEDNYESRYADYDINSPESVIGLTIMQEEFLDQSIMLGKMMQDNFSNKLKRNDRKVKQAGFIVLHQTFMPSILVETGFLTNKSEGAYLNSKKGQQEMGKAIAEAIITYKNNTRTTTITPVSVPVVKEPETASVQLPVSATTTEYNNGQVSEEVEKKEEVVSLTEQVSTEEKKSLSGKELNNNTSSTASSTKEKMVPATTVKSAEDDSDKKSKDVNTDIVFKIQLLASAKTISLVPSNFKGLSALSKEPYNNLYRYMYGETNSYDEARLFKNNAVNKGYSTCYIVAYKEGKRIPVPEALKYLSQ
ncbi:N-acetylmuramoyl-L-alanine amidase family protein [Eudoraea chungangensis]|uniref:N-acetylmuramoyl-L-alanine amidase family protein n=1 Tax=Eudoraea chungangensis TaxID=1481905 RepID=UPI0023EA8505|nr:N-acetylmuramoyl-L-alanine amidase [Eudoraea chungangensis]